MNATILHVPTIIAALTGGRRVGMTVGFMFGVFSFVQTLRAPAMLMLFAVQTSIVYDAAICIVPRVLLGLIAYEVNELAEKRGPVPLYQDGFNGCNRYGLPYRSLLGNVYASRRLRFCRSTANSLYQCH